MKKLLGHVSPFFLLSLFLPLASSFAQSVQLPLTPLQNLEAFQPVAGNWQIVGDVFFDRQNPKKIRTFPGQGVFVNLPSAKNRDNLFTNLEHGDVELELEFMTAPGSNSGVYLQGRYEVQIFDSWGQQTPRHSDAGGIYQRWDDTKPEGQRGYDGRPPRLNASRAPGLWQHYRIVFQAPRFNEQGQKIANARFVKVVHNGVTVHENVEVTGPTRSAAFTDEQPLGPLMLQGDHGPVAFRNIRYKTYGPGQVRLQGLKYQAYEGQFEQLPDFSRLTPHKQGESEVLVHHVGKSGDHFAGRYTGTLMAPAPGVYQLELDLGWVSSDPHFRDHKMGAARLTIGDKAAIVHTGQGSSAVGQVELTAGEHPFTLSYFKNRGDRSQSFALYSEGPGVKRQKLNASASEAPRTPPGIITVSADKEPVVLRSFLAHNGQKRTHAVSVSSPEGAHYSLDLRQGALLQVWRGDFVETTTMWHNRGDAQVATPLGSVLPLSGQPSVALLPSKYAAWPDSVQQGSAPFRFQGYRLDQQGRPTFNYSLGSLDVSERLVSSDQGRQLQHELTISGNGAQNNLWVRLAQGSRITRLPDGSYSVNDRQYYVTLPKGKGPRPVVRQINGREELLLPVLLNGKPGRVSYSLVW